jgi:hypothetical protein
MLESLHNFYIENERIVTEKTNFMLLQYIQR